MTTPAQELGTLTPDAIIELLEIDLTPIGGSAIIRFCNNRSGEPILFDGKSYAAWPIIVSKYGASTDGALPAPSVTLSNTRGIVSSLLDFHKPQGAIFRRRRILERHLDSGDDPRPEAQFRPEEFFLDRWSETQRFVVLNLETALAYLTTAIPARRIVNVKEGE